MTTAFAQSPLAEMSFVATADRIVAPESVIVSGELFKGARVDGSIDIAKGIRRTPNSFKGYFWSLHPEKDQQTAQIESIQHSPSCCIPCR